MEYIDFLELLQVCDMAEDEPLDSEHPTAAVAVVWAREPEESVLLIRRAVNESDPWSGHWSFPGGRTAPVDSDLLDTALRELREECRIELARAALIRELPHSWAGRRVGRFVKVAPFVLGVERQLEATPDESEASECVWIPLRTFTDRTLHQWGPAPGVPPERHFPAIGLKGTPLWGFTYKVLCDWTGTEPPPEPSRR